MNVTEHFTVAEFACRDGTPYPSRWVATRLVKLCTALEVIRSLDALLDRPVTILSGYRTPAYNAKIGGARASQHVEGYAADIVVKGLSPARVHAEILALYRTDAIEIGGLDAYPSFTHVDVRVLPIPPRLARWSGSRKES